MKHIIVANLYIPEESKKYIYTTEQVQEHSHSWQICPNCRHILCSCGNCHNTEQCNQPCLLDVAS